MKNLLGTILCTIITLQVVAQKLNVTGKVTDKQTNEPLIGATIMLNNFTTITNEKGEFVFKKINEKTYAIKVTNVGYSDYVAVLSKEQLLQPLVIHLSSIALNLDELEVKSIRVIDNSPFTKTNLNKEQIAKVNVGKDLPFILNETPSVVVNADAGNGVGYTGIRIRGTDATRINVTLNGIPYNDAESQGTFFVNLPDIVSSAKSIQIQRGTGTSTNGTAAFGAAINISTNEFNEKPYSEINNVFGSFNTWKNTVKAGTGLLENHFTVDARLSQIKSDGYVDRASSNLQSFYISGAYINKKSSLRLNIFSGKEKTYQAWNGVSESMIKTNRTYNTSGTEKPGTPYDNETDNYRQTHYQLFFNHKFSNNWSANFATFLTRGIGYYENYKANEKLANYGLPNVVIGSVTIAKTDIVRQLWLDNYFYGNIFSVEYKKDKLLVLLGGGWSKYDGKHYGKIPWATLGIEKDFTFYNVAANKNEFHTYGKMQQKFQNNFSVFADVQFRHVQHTMNGFRKNPTLNIDRKFDFINPKIGVTYNKNNWQAFISYALTHKEPNRDDFEAGTTMQPNAETLHNFELGVEKKINQFHFATTLYYMLYKNQLVLTGKVNDVGAYTRINAPNSYRLGIELQTAYVFNNYFNVAGNVTLSANKIQSFTEFIDDYDHNNQVEIKHTNSDITLSPSVIASTNINFLPTKNFEISLIGKYVGKQYLDNTQNENRMLKSFYTQDVRCIYTIKNKIFKEWNLLAQINNVFNKMYEPNGYTYSYIYAGSLTTENYYFPMAGVNFLIGINVNL